MGYDINTPAGQAAMMKAGWDKFPLDRQRIEENMDDIITDLQRWGPNKEVIRKNISLFFAYLKENEMIVVETQFKYTYNVLYKDKLVCSLGFDGVEQNCKDLWIEIVGDYSTEYIDIPIDEYIKEITWANVTHCDLWRNTWTCANCDGGKQRIIFKKVFDNICHFQMIFYEVDLDVGLECLKKLLAMRKSYILMDVSLNQYLDF